MNLWIAEARRVQRQRNASLLLAFLLAMMLLITMALIERACAQSGSFYGPTGQYLGSFDRNGPNTTFYGPTGGYRGSTFQTGPNTSLHGPTGEYLGSIYSPNGRSPPCCLINDGIDEDR